MNNNVDKVIERGDTTYFYVPYSDAIQSATVEDFAEDAGKEWVKVHGDGKRPDAIIGSFFLAKEECFPSREICEAAVNEMHEKRQRVFSEQIENESDLVVFLFAHDLAEDNDARLVAEQKASEFFDVNLANVSFYEERNAVNNEVHYDPKYDSLEDAVNDLQASELNMTQTEL